MITENNKPTIETIITGKNGSVIVVHRYGVDDFSAWFTDDNHINDEMFGYSVRGSLIQIIREINDEL